ncbi:hypothetical protein ANCCAN_06567 [Ancylostoma caninum]|uniref:Kazal-like domain-containing protein n=1 Tax=Ancylostoma caninum TaxID=29170 RepID=A0A368GVB2_ANCCA|nr:hypothetical protein ANCCAN_06567 [Ancylostoma caninum]
MLCKCTVADLVNIRGQLPRDRLYDKQCILNECLVFPYGTMGECPKTGVIYQLRCLSCKGLYILKTHPVLCAIIKEHLASEHEP